MKTTAKLKALLCGILPLVVATQLLNAQDEDGDTSSLLGVNGGKTIVAAPAKTKPLKIGIYNGPGSGDSGVANVSDRAKQIPGTTITQIKPEDMGTVDLTQFDVVVFSGGSGSAQAKAIGDAGKQNVRRYIDQGGGYVGICAGAYLACAGFDWSLGILDARTVSNKWKRGRGYVEIQVADSGKDIIGNIADPFYIRYANGPIIKPLNRPDLPDYKVAAWFRTELAENGTPAGVMIDSPAAAYSTFGKGRVFILSPHSENTPGLENMVPRALLWAAKVTD